MSGQYPGHSRPPVGTPPPQTVWNHLTMAQGQGLNMHPTALPGAALNAPGFYTHPSMTRASHLASQLTPQLAHTQAPPTWHTPTVPSKPVTPSSASGSPLFSLQMLVDNRQNQNQYRNSPGSQSTLDLSATSDIAENYSRIPQDIPISLTARSVDKSSRNGNIISPPIPLNGETSSDSGISSSVPTPNSISEPVSLSTKEITTPKITVKNFESNLKGVANLHDKVKDLNMDNFAQKMMNLPPSVTIERVSTEKKDHEVLKSKDSLSVIAQGPRSILPVIVNLTSKTAEHRDVTDSPRRETNEMDRKVEECSVRSPKHPLKRGKKGVDSLLEKLEGGNKKLGCMENIGSVIVTPIEEKDACSIKSMSPERQKSKSPSREDEVISPSFSNDDSNDNGKQRRKRKLEKPVRLSKDSKTEVEDMELEPTEPSVPRMCEPIPEKANSLPIPKQEERIEENQPIRRRRSSEGPASNVPPNNQRARRKSSDDATEFSKVTSPKGIANANPFNEVESELEKMFAGIVETDAESKEDLPKVESMNTEKENVVNVDITENEMEAQDTKAMDVTSTVETKPSPKKTKKGKGRGGKRKISRSADAIFGSDIGDLPQKETKKKRASKNAKKQDISKKTKKTTKVDGLREMAYDSGSNASSIRSRGPVVHVEGPRDSPLSVQVVNAPREEEEEKSKEKRKSVGNGNTGRSKRLSHQNDLDYRGKVSRAGLFSSTLSSRYDAHTTDSTWVCVFCKQGPHSVVPGDPARPHPNLSGPHIAAGTYMVPAGVLSDLFGPYLIGKERLEDGVMSADEQEITTEQKKGGKNKRSLRHAGLADQFAAKMGKKKRNSIEGGINTMLTGMTQLPGEEQRWEVWLHEQCAVWAAGVYMAGGRVTGLQEAVWDAAKSVCDSCGFTGANIGCVKRGCRSVTHYPCALTKGWLLDTNQYIPKCNLHRVT
ncbi:transcription factor 20 [Neodiprion virginianus]|uniref:transcription factor 20 n=1 Tax=Neodiprion virginianus TaxID=2961670 RepID=UPI001EE6E1AD|nr:transcription factor 20 [Neodiprion virginianus]XP_046604182.1 transcription factor 20 [Neodiprion virginianus]XP_046604183.1 transcription factor 20 [Neodiprion virginianus]XP_046604184.1 transcription factor 20 [Neodiprion virginianus]